MSKEDQNEEEKRPENIISAYNDRLKVLRRAQEYSQKGEIPKAVEKYSLYLGTLAAYMKVQEHELKPALFDRKKDMTEMLLISHSYWDLAKAYDRSPRLQKESIRCLNQFVVFSLGFKYQHINAQMIKKALKKKGIINKKAFQQAFDRLNVESKACYLATHAFPNNEYKALDNFHYFKSSIQNNKLGKSFIYFYYLISPKIVTSFKRHKTLDFLINMIIFKPVLLVLSGIIGICRK